VGGDINKHKILLMKLGNYLEYQDMDELMDVLLRDGFILISMGTSSKILETLTVILIF
jgi:hypothetical protein